ncbi:EamA family transporter [Chromobacterium violaceum]|uniref:EamA family transporter n=1 Tax=Chromobacterium violaceum TaxID=536 RepID=UPI0015FC6C2D|nr:EamA family transporter [Chromobacterium violaceum]MBA8735138.1 EamA family transporter [Chromobacterium violaceum]
MANSSPIDATAPGMAGRGRSRAWSGAALALASMCCAQFGAALSQPAAQSLGVFRATALKLAFAAAFLWLWRRPPLRRALRGEPVLLGLGLAMAGLLLGFFAALRTLPQGLTVAITLLGPLALAWGKDRRRWPWPMLALVGTVLLARREERWLIDVAGLAWAGLSAACWAVYIVLLRRAGEVCRDGDGVALALLVAALAAAPWIWLDGGAWPDASMLLRLAGLSLLMPALPCLLELEALRRMPAASFGVLMSLEPALAVSAGGLLLGQTPAVVQQAGLALVVAASLGALAGKR